MVQENLIDNIRRYMKLNGHTIPSLAKKAEISPATLSNLLNDNSDPRLSILSAIAEALNIGMIDLFAEKPKFSSFRFRTYYALNSKESAHRDNLLFTTEKKLKEYSQLEDMAQNRLAYVNNIPSFNSPYDAAHYVREIADLQSNEPIINICSVIKILGIKFFHFDFKIEKTFGASVNEKDGGPAIIINSSIPNVERKIFTIAHELGHLLLHKNSYKSPETLDKKDSKEETEANEFAGELLCPMECVYEAVKDTRNFGFIEAIMNLKQKYKVSYGTALHQYCNKYSTDYDTVLRKFRAMYTNKYHKSFKGHFEPFEIPPQLYRFEDEHLRDVVLELYQEERISAKDAAETLQMTEAQIKRINVLDEDEGNLPF